MEWFSGGTRMEIGPVVKCPVGYYEGSRRKKRERGLGDARPRSSNFFL